MKMTPDEARLKAALLAEIARVASAEPGLIPWHDLIGGAVSCGISKISGEVGVRGPQAVQVELTLWVHRDGIQPPANVDDMPTGGPFGEGGARQ